MAERYFMTGSDTEPDLNITIEMADLERRFTYHPPQPGQPEVYQAIRDKARELAGLILGNSPRLAAIERETAIQKIEEAVMWANAGIARHGPSPYTYVRIEHEGEEWGTPPYDQTTFECDAYLRPPTSPGVTVLCARKDAHSGQPGPDLNPDEWERDCHWSTVERPTTQNHGMLWIDTANGAGRGE